MDTIQSPTRLALLTGLVAHASPEADASAGRKYAPVKSEGQE